jgi:hypothetical protein
MSVRLKRRRNWGVDLAGMLDLPDSLADGSATCSDLNKARQLRRLHHGVGRYLGIGFARPHACGAAGDT